MSEKHYNALISPDAYEYLDKAPEDFIKDEMLEEQETLEDSLFDDDPEEHVEENVDDSDMYRYNSLFDEIDNEEDNSSEETAVAEEPEKDPLVFSDEDDDSISVNPAIRDVPTTNEFIQHIVKQLPKYDTVATLLLGSDRALQDDIEDTVKRAREAWMKDRKDKMFIIPDSCTSVAVLSQTYDPMVAIQRLENIGAVMVSNDQNSWNALMLYYAPDGSLAEVNTVKVSPSVFTDWQWKTVLERGEKLRSISR